MTFCLLAIILSVYKVPRYTYTTCRLDLCLRHIVSILPQENEVVVGGGQFANISFF